MAVPRPAGADERTTNPLRPRWLADVIGQPNAKALMGRAIDSCFERKSPLDHTLITGPSGTGKSTFSHVLANELGVEVYELEAPVSHDTLAQLRTTMRAADILKIEEIHQQAMMERRGRSGATQPEVLYALMEDRVLQTATGVLPYPQITVIGTTTDPGRLPEAFLNRFPLRPRLDRYTVEDMQRILLWNGQVLDVPLSEQAVAVFAQACRGVPREANNLVKNARILFAPGEYINRDRALQILATLKITEDGLTVDMRAMLVFLYTKARQENANGEVRYQASVTTIATAIGLSRDTKAVALYVEPFLIERGFVQVGHSGRFLTDAGIRRAKELIA